MISEPIPLPADDPIQRMVNEVWTKYIELRENVDSLSIPHDSELRTTLYTRLISLNCTFRIRHYAYQPHRYHDAVASYDSFIRKYTQFVTDFPFVMDARR